MKCLRIDWQSFQFGEGILFAKNDDFVFMSKVAFHEILVNQNGHHTLHLIKEPIRLLLHLKDMNYT